MRAFLLIAAFMALTTVACDDVAVQTRALDILEHGVTEAHATCTGNASFPFAGTPGDFGFSLSKLVDGSVIAHLAVNDSKNYTISNFCPRGSDCAVNPALVLHEEHSGDNTATFALEGGLFTVVMDGPGFIPPHDPTPPYTAFSDEIIDACTGFNMEAFD